MLIDTHLSRKSYLENKIIDSQKCLMLEDGKFFLIISKESRDVFPHIDLW